MGLTLNDVGRRIQEKFPDVQFVEIPGDPYVLVKPEHIADVCVFLKKTPELSFDYCSCVSGLDDGQKMWVVYHLYSISRNHRAVIKVEVDRADPIVLSVAGLWKGANWHERETYDMYGIRFDGHPDLRRILLPEDWPGHPLRKDYEFPDEYQGIPLK